MALKRIGAGKRMSTAVIHGNKVYLAGVTPDAALGKSVAEQTKDVLAQIDAVLAEAGTSKTNIIKANIWLTDIGTFAEMNSVWDAWVVAGETPARATVESKLAAPGIDVEIMVEAALERAGGGGRGAGRGGGRAARKAGGGGAGGGGGGRAARKAGGGAPRSDAERAARKAARKAKRAAK